MNYKLLLLLVLLTGSFSRALAQCEVTLSVSPSATVCGDCARLTAFGQGQGQQVFNENFNNGSASAGWAFTQQATFNNPCSPGGVDGTTHIWMGSSSANPRTLRTQAYNFIGATSGATVCFDMLFAQQGNASPCEGPDEPQEGVYLQYSTNGGSTWVTIHYFDPNGGNDPSLINWHNWCFQLPPGAITASTQLRWHQDNVSANVNDHWGIDNVEIYYNDPTYIITTTHDNYSWPLGSSGGVNPNPVCPSVTTDYYVVMTNGIFTCRDTVRLNVVNPTIVVNAGNDTSICPATCATLNGTAKVIKKPHKTPTYSNTQLESIQTGLAGTTNVNINVTDLNMTNILPNSITSVCISNLTFFGFSFFPPGTQTIGDLRLNLLCPDGTTITLVPNGVTTSSSPLQGYTNTCFTPVASTNIATGSPPYTGSFAPNQPFNNLVGCTANGLWSIEVVSTSALSFGSGTFSGWSISFDDPEISYPADIVWSPTTNMTNSTTLRPTVCPAGTGPYTYTLTATDTAGCITVSDAVTVTVQPNCCNLAFTSVAVQPTCATSNGSITMNVTTGTGPYTYAWTGGATGASRTGLPAGSYTVRITDLGQTNCFKDTTIVLTTTNPPTISSIIATPELCAGNNNGSIAVTAGGGTGALTYAWTPTATGANPTGLAPANYSVTVTDTRGCTATSSVILTPGPVCCTLAFTSVSTNPTCGGTDGSITVTPTSGSGNYTYAWAPGSSSTGTLSSIGSGTYSVTVHDVTQNCDHDTTITLSSANAPTINSITQTPETCQGANDGTATVNASGGTGTLTYEWDNTPAGITSTITGLTPGAYFVTVTDGVGCEAIANIVVLAGPNCCNLSYTIVPTNPGCGLSNGAITVSNIVGSGNYTYAWSSGPATQSLTGVAAGPYGYTITDNTYPNCQRDTTITLINPNAPSITVTWTNELCLGANDGTASVAINGGAPPYTEVWSVAGTTPLTGLAAGTYGVTVTDNAGCQATGSATILAGPSCCNLSFGITPVNPTCGQSNGSLEVVSVNGTGPYTYAWSNGAITTALNSGLAANTYTVTVTDQGQPNCTHDSTITLNNPGAPTTGTSSTIETCLGDNDATATVTVTGGVAPITYDWSNGGTTSTITGLAPGTYDVTVEDVNGCQAIDQVIIVAGPQCCSLTATAATTQSLCSGANGSITVTVDATSGQAPFVIGINGGTQGNSNVFGSLSAGIYTIEVTDDLGCDYAFSATVTEANNNLAVTIAEIDPSCPGSADGELTSTTTGGAAPYTYSWTGGLTSADLTGLVSGTYDLTVTDLNNCTATTSASLTDPAPLTVDLGLDVTRCFGDSAVLDAGIADAYLWSGGETTQTITVTASGTYSITITNAGLCSANDAVDVIISPAVTVDAGLDTTIIKDEFTATLQPTVAGNGAGTYEWTPAEGLSCSDCASPIAAPENTTLFTLIYTDGQGCVGRDSLTITVLEGEYYAYVPNAFTPNNDRYNNTLKVFHKGVSSLVFSIFNRWGEKVFETRDLNAEWDGTYKGREAQIDVYVYELYVEYKNITLSPERKKGSVMLMK